MPPLTNANPFTEIDSRNNVLRSASKTPDTIAVKSHRTQSPPTPALWKPPLFPYTPGRNKSLRAFVIRSQMKCRDSSLFMYARRQDGRRPVKYVTEILKEYTYIKACVLLVARFSLTILAFYILYTHATRSSFFPYWKSFVWQRVSDFCAQVLFVCLARSDIRLLDACRTGQHTEATKVPQ